MSCRLSSAFLCCAVAVVVTAPTNTQTEVTGLSLNQVMFVSCRPTAKVEAPARAAEDPQSTPLPEGEG